MKSIQAAGLIVALASVAMAEITAPIAEISATSSNISLRIANSTTGGTYTIERAAGGLTNTWAEVESFEGSLMDTNHVFTVDSDASFFRVTADPYHEKVGQVATFVEVAHGVAGTAHIVNNRTIELRNFYFDGQGIDVQLYLSPNPSFSPYISVSDNLVGTVFSNATVQIELPPTADLNDISYISVWCVPVGVSFGDGQFQ